MANKKKNTKSVATSHKEEAKTSKKKNTNIEKEEMKEEKVELEPSAKGGMSETARGMIIGMIITALIAGIIILLILGKNDETVKSSGTTSDVTMMQSFETYFAKKQPTLIVFASSQCGWCSLQKPIVERIGKMYNIDYLYLDVLQLSTTEREEVINSLGIKGDTPTSVVVQNGKVVSVLNGMREGKGYVEFLVSAGVLKEGSTYQDEDQLIELDYDTFKTILAKDEVSAILFDQYSSCGANCLTERANVNKIAKENKISVYHLPDTAINEEFVNGLGDWGYATESYKESKSVNIPLLMIVRNGKIIWYQEDSLTEENIVEQFKKYGVIQ